MSRGVLRKFAVVVAEKCGWLTFVDGDLVSDYLDPQSAHVAILRRGTAAWNEWRERHIDIQPQLTGAVLRGMKNLSGANFRNADLRGADFSGIDLTAADFTNAIAGLQRHWAKGVVMALFTLSVLVALIAWLGGVFGVNTVAFFSRKALVLPGTALLIVFVVLYLFAVLMLSIAIIRRGLEYAWLIDLVVLVVPGTIAWAFLSDDPTGIAPVFVGLSWAGSGTLFEATFGAIFVVAVAAIWGARWGDVVGVMGVGVVVPVAIILGPGLAAEKIGGPVIVLAGAALGAYVSRRTSQGDERYALVRKMAIWLSAIGGTSLRKATLTDANFTEATIKGTDFRMATLSRTFFHRAEGLDRARVGDSYLNYPKVQQMFVTGNGQNENFDAMNLEGINLQGLKLRDASFVRANLNNANLRDAKLCRSKLKQTQLDGTDLTGATLTGAYIEDWGITGHTKLDGVRCRYVFMRVPTHEHDHDVRRKPDNRHEFFEDGDFAKFIMPWVNTLDLYHNQDVDPRAIAIAFRRLVENNPEAELEMVAMEKRGPDQFMVRAETSERADKSELSAQYFAIYRQLKALPHDELVMLAATEGELARRYANMIETALNQPKIIVKTLQTEEVFMSEYSEANIKIGGDVTGSTINLGKISGSVSNVVNQLPSSPVPNQPGIKELLTQLQAAIEEATELSQEDKADALEEVKVLAELGLNPQQPDKEGLGRKAVKILKGTVSGLADTAKLVEALGKLMPEISKTLGL